LRPEDFRDPGKKYRPSPFWSWNDLLDPDELRWQVREFADKGFGGYFMHSRVGLATPYLSQEWMRCIDACLDEGKKTNVESWLYDEDKWPSGFAGGIVPAQGDEYRSRTLAMKEIEKEDVDSALKDTSVVGVFEVALSPSSVIEEFERKSRSSDVKGGKLLAFGVKITPRSNWYNGESYVDLLDPKVTEEFLKVTIDPYAENFKKGFGEYMPGIFTDEPNYFHRVQLESVPWTEEIIDYFQKVNGYDITDRLPLLFFDGEGCEKVRYDFWRTLTLRFIEAWTIPYSKRCEKYGLKMTGHYLCEDDLVVQTKFIGAAMPHYEYIHVPGIDHLGLNINDPLTLKQCSSVAHQFGKTRVLCEIFGCSGHNMTFEDQKWIADFHFALGITFLCQHLTLYTQKGDAKRDYPPTVSYHQTYWPHYKLMNDYFSRAGYLCSQGRFYADILVLHPIGSVWATYSSKSSENHESRAWKYNEGLVKLQENLLALHWDFDYGDEIILERHARVEGREAFIVNEGRYRLMIVPPSLTWARKTVDLLIRFLERGGKVLFVGETPRRIDGQPAEADCEKILTHPSAVHVTEDRKSIDNSVEKILSRSVSVADEEENEIEDIYVHHRVEGRRHIYFLSNKSRTLTHEAMLTFAEKGGITEWNLFDGSTTEVEAVTYQGKTVVYATFHQAGSHAYVIDTSKPGAPEGLPSDVKAGFEETALKLPVAWKFERLHPNSMTLDTCRYSLDGGEWSEEMPIWKARREVWRAAGLEQYTGIQPWVLIQKGIKPSRAFALRLRSTFESKVEKRNAYLILEKAPFWRLHINEKPVPTDTKDWHWDKKFGKIDITDYVEIGENVIELSCQYDREVPVEDLFLIGDFGVEKVSEAEYALADEPDNLSDRDWVEQGYPFYAGTIRYKTSFNVRKRDGERVLVRLLGAKGSLFLVYVNGEDSVPICCQPLEADVTRFVNDGENELVIDVVSSLRNTFGPLHHKLGDALTFVGPFSFVDEKNWVESYQFTAYGLINGVEIVTRRRFE
jgi:hypothetical protein